MATIGSRIRAGGGGLSTGQMIALAGALLGGALLGWYGFKTFVGDGTTTAVPLSAQAITVRPSTLTLTATTSGSINTQATSKMVFNVAGQVKTINVKQGQSVQAGGTVATLDTTNLGIALNQAKSQYAAAQAALASFTAPPTQDVIAADQAAIVQAQQAAAAAQNSLATAQTVGTTDQANVAGQQATISGLQYGVAQAADTAATADNAVQTAQNNYTAAISGPQPEDVAVSRTQVTQAATSLSSAQATYDRLVNHTDVATRPETTALVTASASYQAALADLANALPQPSNPYDIANAQAAVTAAGSQASTAQLNAAIAQDELNTAEQAPAVSPSINLNASCTAVGSGGGTNGNTALESVCGNIGGPGGITPANTSLDSAEQAANSAAGDVITAQTSYQTALNNLQKLINPISTQNFSGLQAQVDAARQQLDIARKNFDNYISLPDLAVRPEKTALDSAQSGYNLAVANYNLKVALPLPTTLSNDQVAVGTAQNAADSAHQSVGSAQTNVDKAQADLQSAIATESTIPSSINAAQASVQSAQSNVASAQAKLAQDQAGPIQSDIQQKQEAVTQAQLALQTAQYNYDNATLKSPVTGVITIVTANVGDQVGTASPIATVVDVNHVELDAQVDEATYGQVRVGMPVLIQMDSVQTASGAPLTGFITQIVPSGTVAQGVVLFPIVIQVTTPNVVLPNQASASQITIILQSVPNALSVRPNFVYRNGATTYVDVLSKDGKRVPTAVTLGLTTSAADQITSGLKAGDQVLPPLKKGATTAAGGGIGGLLPGGAPGGAP